MIVRGKYFDGLNAVSVPVDLFIEGNVLRIETAEGTAGRWPLGSIFRDESHSVSVVIGCAAGEDRVEVVDPSVVAALNISKRVWAINDLRDTKRILIPSFIALLAVVFVGLWHSRVLTRYLATKVTLEQEQKVLALVERDSLKNECTLNSKQSFALDKLLARLYRNDPENRASTKVKILSLNANNAFTLPGGEIWILKPLLMDVQTPAELAGVLAHEIEHVEKRHVVESIIRSALFTGLLNALAGDVSGFLLIDPSTAAQILGMKLSREMEEEADDGALKRLLAAGISPIGASEFFVRLEQRDPTSGRLEFLSTHPGSAARAKRFWEADRGRTDPPIMTEEEWADLQSSCETVL